MLELVLGPNFGPNRKFKIFTPNFAQKGYFPSKAQEANVTIEFSMLELVSVPNFN